MKARLLSNFLGAAILLVIVSALPNLAQSQKLLHSTLTPLVTANDTEMQDDPEIYSTQSRIVNSV